MSVHDVPRARWAAVLDQFSRAHHGWLTRVMCVGPEPALRSATSWSPLQSIAAVVDGTHVVAVCIRVRDGSPTCVGPLRALAVGRDESGLDRALEIDAADGEFTRVTFRATARSDELDGIAPAEIATS